MREACPFHFLRFGFALAAGFHLWALFAQQNSKSQNETSPYYTVQVNESVSEILFRLRLRPIYGAGNFLEKTMHLNPELKLSSANLVRPGYALRLPIATTYSSDRFQILEFKEVVILEASPPTRDVSASPDFVENLPQPVTSPEHPKELSEQPKSMISHFVLGGSSGFHAIKGEDSSDGTSGLLNSKLSAGAFFDWHQHWSSKLKTVTGFELQEVSIENTDDDKVITSKNKTLAQFHFSPHWSFRKRSSVGLKFSVGHMLLYQGLGSGVYQVDAIHRQSSGLVLRQQILENGPMSLNFNGEMGVLKLQTDSPYNQSSGQYYSIGLQSVYSKGSWGVTSEMNYNFSAVEIETVKYGYESFNLKLGMVRSWAD